MTKAEPAHDSHARECLALMVGAGACSLSASLAVVYGVAVFAAGAISGAVAAAFIRYRKVGVARAWTTFLATVALQSVVLLELAIVQLRRLLPSPLHALRYDAESYVAGSIAALSALVLYIAAVWLTGTVERSESFRGWSYRIVHILVMGSTVLAILGLKRLGDRPTPENYFASLEVIQELPAARAELCQESGTGHHPALDEGRCSTLERDLGDISVHYHCGGRCVLYCRMDGSGEIPLFAVNGSHPEAVRWDPYARAWVWGRPDWLQVVRQGRGKAIRLADLAPGMSASRAWTVVALGGVATGCLALGLAWLSKVPLERRRLGQLVSLVRGHLGAFALATILITNALLLGALIEGFVV